MSKIIVNFAPTGMVPQKKDTPYIPTNKNEIIDQVLEAYELGISMVHLHAREPATETAAYRKELYGEIIEGIREYAGDLVICASTSGRVFSDFEKRSQVLSLSGDLKPDMGSLTLSSLNFNKQASVNGPGIIIELADEMQKRGIKPELEVFDLGMMSYANYLISKGILKAPYYFNIILGNISSAQSDLLHIGAIIKDLPPNSIFSLGGIGAFQLQTNSLAISMGYGIRIGLEDNIWFDGKRTLLATNASLLKRAREIADANEKEFMSPCELRKLLNLKEGFGQYGSNTDNSSI